MIKINRHTWLNLPGILMVFFLPFSTSIPNLIIPFGIAAIIYKKVIKDKIIYKPIIPFFLFFSLLIVLFLFKKLFIEDIKIIQRIFLVILSAFIILNTRKKQIIFALIVSINLAIIYSLLKILNYVHVNGTIDLSNGEIIYGVLPIERPYLGFALLIVCLLLFDKFKKNQINKKIAIFLILVNVSFVFFIAARLTIITFIVIIFWYFFKYLKVNLIYKILGLTLFLILSVSLLSINNNFTKRLKLDEGIESVVDYEPRFVIWPCVINILKEDYSKLVIGPLGFESGTNALKKCYSSSIEKADKREWYLKKGFNAHNQFLAIIMITGVLGLILFLYFLVQLYKTAKNNFVNESIVFGLLFFFLLECLLYRQLGCYLVGLIISLVSKKNEQ